MGDYPAYLVRMRQLKPPHFLHLSGYYRVDLRQETHGRVIKQAGSNSGAFDQPAARLI
jgi:hypothetical protein